ncbi:hypothetical protein JCM33374_g1283 [Metschnikowia sp. JCM 33374]|nr:hypothetical protein JCM33374_g1283 [Metschnikowia sp. JCM 33374]
MKNGYQQGFEKIWASSERRFENLYSVENSNSVIGQELQVARETSPEKRPARSKQTSSDSFDSTSISNSTSPCRFSVEEPDSCSTHSHNPCLHSLIKTQCSTNTGSIPSQSSNTPIRTDRANESTTPDVHLQDHMASPPSVKNSEISSQGTTKEYKTLNETTEAFKNSTLQLGRINAHNFSGFLVEFLKSHHQHIPLDNLFHLLYIDSDVTFDSSVNPTMSTNETPEIFESKHKGLKYCSTILQTFQNQPPAPCIKSTSEENLSVPSVNFHELLRTFLAIKILFASVQRVGASPMKHLSVSCEEVYKVYYILCQKLIQKSGISYSISGNIVLGHSKLGKLTNLIYPNIVKKRLGKRGKSKSHYVGFTWNKSLVDTDVLKLIDLGLPQIKEYFGHSHIKVEPASSFHRVGKKPQEAQKRISRGIEAQPRRDEPAVCGKPVHSYVDLSFTYPYSDCSPRDWETTPNKVPDQAPWVIDNLKRSVAALCEHDVGLEQLILDFKAGKYYDGNVAILPQAACRAINVLREASSEKEAFMHFYLVSIKLCETRLDNEYTHCGSYDQVSLTVFIKVLRKMGSVIEMSSCKIKADYAEGVLSEMVRVLEMSGCASPESFDSLSPLEGTYIKSIILSMNAYNFKPVDENAKASDKSLTDAISKLAKTFKDSDMVTKDSMSRINYHEPAQELNRINLDVPFQAFKLGVRDFHQRTLAEPLVMKLPIPMISFIMLHKTHRMQYASFRDFGNHDPDFSTEIFKSWWVFSSMYQEYMSICSEIVSLIRSLEIASIKK